MSDRCFIIPAYIEGSLSELMDPAPGDLVICADGGYEHALKEGIRPDVFVGDLDSYRGALPDEESGIEIIRLPAVKDDTDTEICVREALKRGCRDIVIVGGLGGRFDHTVANIQTLARALDEAECSISINSKNNYVTLIGPCAEYRVKRVPGCKLSLLSFSDKCTGVSASGVFYPLKDAVLTNSYPLGVSNEFTDEFAVISVGSGRLLVIVSRDM